MRVKYRNRVHYMNLSCVPKVQMVMVSIERGLPLHLTTSSELICQTMSAAVSASGTHQKTRDLRGGGFLACRRQATVFGLVHRR